MGKKKDEEVSEEKYEFIPADFDEDAFIHKEMIGFKTTVTMFLMGILAAVVSWGLFIAVGGAKVGWLLGMAVFGVFFLALKPLYKQLRIDISHYQRREWLGTGFLLFFTWLAFWLIFINPPLSDFAEPQVELYASPGVATVGGSVVIDVFYTDNAGVTDREFTLMGPDGIIADETQLEHVTGPHYRYTARNLTAGSYTTSAIGTDSKGLAGNGTASFEVRADIIKVEVGDLRTAAGTVIVKVPLEPSQVYLVRIDVEGSDNPVYMEYVERTGGWEALANFDGWLPDQQNNFTVVVVEKNRFHGNLLIAGGIMTDGPHTAQVGDVGDYKGGVPKKANPTNAPVKDVPSAGVALLAVGLLGTAVVVRRRRA